MAPLKFLNFKHSWAMVIIFCRIWTLFSKLISSTISFETHIPTLSPNFQLISTKERGKSENKKPAKLVDRGQKVWGFQIFVGFGPAHVEALLGADVFIKLVVQYRQLPGKLDRLDQGQLNGRNILCIRDSPAYFRFWRLLIKLKLDFLCFFLFYL